MNDRTDHELMYAYAHGDHKAFESFYARYRKKLYVYAYSILKRTHEAEEAMHEVFAKLISNVGTFSKANNVSSFLFAACRNHCLNVLKSRKHEEAQLSDFQILKVKGPLQQAAEHEEADLLNEIIASLPEGQREVLVLKAFSGLTLRQIAGTTGQPMGTVATRYRLALDKIKVGLARTEEVRRV